MAVHTVRLDDQLERRLTRLSKETERPKSYIVKKALALYLDEYQDYETALEMVLLHWTGLRPY